MYKMFLFNLGMSNWQPAAQATFMNKSSARTDWYIINLLACFLLTLWFICKSE